MDNEQNHEQATTQSTESSEVSERSLVSQLQEQLKKAEDKSAYLAADIDNVRRRSAQELKAQLGNARASILVDMVGVLDNFERSMSELETTTYQHSADLKAHLKGLNLIYRQLKKALADHGVVEIPASKSFNPELHEAVMQVAEGEGEPGAIVTVFQKGYQLNGQLLRPAKVSVKS